MTQTSTQTKIIIQAMCLFACLMVIVSITGCGQATLAPNTTATPPVEQTPASSDTAAPPATEPTTKPPTTPAPAPATKSSFKDGSYTAEGAYGSPAGPESITVALTLKNDIVTDATVTAHATAPKSKYMQNAFISGFKTLVVGKNIKDVQLEKVSGSSLTPKGFNDAVAKIQVQAKA